MPPSANYKLVFSDEFNQLSIAHTGTATANWYSGQAWGNGFGDARLMRADSARSPFSIAEKGGESALAITMSRNASGQLESGLISTMFPDGTSRMPQDGNFHGYYETRLWLPEGVGVWPAFWAMEKERLSPNRDHVFEVDVMEQHGDALGDRFSSAIHDWNWNATALEGHTGSALQKVVGTGVLTTGWHTWGIEVTPDLMTFYLDGNAYRVTATPANLDTDPMFMINLAAGGGWPVGLTLDNAKLYVDYFRAYELTASSAAKPAPPTLKGGAANDTFHVQASDTVIDEAAGGGYDTVRSSVDYALSKNVEKLLLLEGDAVHATGNELNNEVFGNARDNVLKGLAGDDYLYGRDGNDMLFGGVGNDKLYGEKGNDVLIGGAGADRLEGGLGADTFVFQNLSDSLPSGFDRIIDFSRAQGDRIDLSAIDANSLVAGDQAFTWIGSQPFTAAGQLRLQKGMIYADVNGDQVADFAVQVGNVSLSGLDFIL